LKQKSLDYFRNFICPVGATAAEYAIIIILIAAVIVIIVAAIGGEVREMFETVKWW
jgi:Flp pilus assembly pilin Flp